jgi:hypothetical protein
MTWSTSGIAAAPGATEKQARAIPPASTSPLAAASHFSARAMATPAEYIIKLRGWLDTFNFHRKGKD